MHSAHATRSARDCPLSLRPTNVCCFCDLSPPRSRPSALFCLPPFSPAAAFTVGRARIWNLCGRVARLCTESHSHKHGDMMKQHAKSMLNRLSLSALLSPSGLKRCDALQLRPQQPRHCVRQRYLGCHGVRAHQGVPEQQVSECASVRRQRERFEIVRQI